jgi:hypothetical protein
VKENETKPIMVLASERGASVEWVDRVTPMLDNRKIGMEWYQGSSGRGHKICRRTWVKG